MEAHREPYIEDNSLIRAPSPLPCELGECINPTTRGLYYRGPCFLETPTSQTLQCTAEGCPTACLGALGNHPPSPHDASGRTRAWELQSRALGGSCKGQGSRDMHFYMRCQSNNLQAALLVLETEALSLSGTDILSKLLELVHIPSDKSSFKSFSWIAR